MFKRYAWSQSWFEITDQAAREELEPLYLDATPEVMKQIQRGLIIPSEVADYRRDNPAEVHP